MIYRSGLLGALLCLQLLLVAGAAYLDARDASGEQGELLVPIAVDAVDKMVIHGEERQVELAKLTDGWVVGERVSGNDKPVSANDTRVPANDEKVAEVLEKLSALRLGWPVATSADTQERFEVAADRYQRNIELYQGEAKVGSAYFGSSPGYRRVHARSAESNDIYSLGFSTFELPTTVDDWLDKALLGATGAITEITRGGRWTLSKTAEGWMLVDLPGAALTADQDAVGQLVERLRGFRVMALADSEATADWESADKLTVADGDGVHELQLWHDAETDEYVVHSSRATSRYTAASYAIEQILVEAVDLAVEDAAPTD